MIPPLFEKFFNQSQALIQLFKLAPTKLSTYGLEKDRPTEGQKTKWGELVADISNSDKKLKELVELGVVKNHEAIDVELETYRELSRRMEYCNCYWSAYYSEISNLQDEIAIQIDQIDEKYQLGWEALD